uniref:SUI1 domain-containing protein n=1 Tax=viral metagenome TaxID=1070528 RepID=A0A6C0EMN3_9ZZZZ
MNSIINDIEAEITGRNAQKQQKMHVRIQQRTGRKNITILQGISLELDIKNILKDMKKQFSCGGSVQRDENDLPVVVLFGDQRQNILSYFITHDLATRDDFVLHGY